MKTVHDIIKEVSPYYKSKKEPETEHQLVYDSATEGLEPVYFFILDLMYDHGYNVEKIADSFTSSPGSGHFAELQQRASVMQQQATKAMGDINTVLRSVLSILYDLKDFRTRLAVYDDLNSDDEKKKEAARLSLKQIWMDKVDMQKQQSSIKAMGTTQAGFSTVIDAFLVAKDEKDADKIDLNDRVKRIVKQRINEFNQWVEQSEKELRKRYEVEKNYLRSQVNSLKLYSKWVKPYLRAASQLEQKEQGKNPDIVDTFNSILLELTLFGKSKIDIKGSFGGDLPKDFSKKKYSKFFKRDYYKCVIIDFYFRGIPQRISQQSHYSFGGKTYVTFTGYALNSDEIEKIEKELDNRDLEDTLELIQGATDDSLEQIQKEINYFLDEQTEEEKKEEKKKEKEKKKDDGSNPFLALIGAYNKKDKNEKSSEKNKDKKEKEIKKDNWYEKKFVRSLAANEAANSAFDLFDIYKKSHGMASYT